MPCRPTAFCGAPSRPARSHGARGTAKREQQQPKQRLPTRMALPLGTLEVTATAWGCEGWELRGR